MIKSCFFISILILLLLPYTFSYGQNSKTDSIESYSIDDSSYYFIRVVDVIGLKRTRKKIILRELDIHSNTIYRGDTLKELLQWNRNKIFNTLLFTTVNTEFITDANNDGFVVNFLVQERWYTFPIPILEIADRNINEWWSDRDRDLSRVDYGLGFNQFNFTGRNDYLKILAQGGFTQKFEGFYRLPYFDLKQKNGITVGASYSTNKNVAFATVDNKLEFTGNLDETLRERFYSTVQFVHRGKYYSFQRAEVRYNRNRISDTIAQLNPDYFLNGSTFQEFISLSLQYTYDKRDVAPYPLNGKFIQFTADAAGLGLSKTVDIYSLTAEYAHFWQLNDNWYAGSRLRAKGSLPGPQAYFLQRGLGYGRDLVRGFERNVIDGQQAMLNRNSLRRRIYNTVYDWGKLSPLEQFKIMPISVYLKTFLDAGYVVDAQVPAGNAPLANKFIYSGGLGLDIVTYYDVVFRVEYSLNSIGNTGLFFHFMADI